MYYLLINIKRYTSKLNQKEAPNKNRDIQNEFGEEKKKKKKTSNNTTKFGRDCDCKIGYWC